MVYYNYTIAQLLRLKLEVIVTILFLYLYYSLQLLGTFIFCKFTLIY